MSYAKDYPMSQQNRGLVERLLKPIKYEHRSTFSAQIYDRACLPLLEMSAIESLLREAAQALSHPTGEKGGLGNSTSTIASTTAPSAGGVAPDFDEPEGCRWCGVLAGTCAAYPNCPGGDPPWYAVKDSESYSSVRYRATLHPKTGEQEMWVAHELSHDVAAQIARDHNAADERLRARTAAYRAGFKGGDLAEIIDELAKRAAIGSSGASGVERDDEEIRRALADVLSAPQAEEVYADGLPATATPLTDKECFVDNEFGKGETVMVPTVFARSLEQRARRAEFMLGYNLANVNKLNRKLLAERAAIGSPVPAYESTAASATERVEKK